MVSIRAAKSKGSQFEYDCQYSLAKCYGFENIYRTAERGFQRQYDLHIVDRFTEDILVFECKRLKGISWNQLIKLYDKLTKVTFDANERYILFKSNFQPCLVFGLFRSDDQKWEYEIKTFKAAFGGEFNKHPSTRAPRK